MDPLVLTKLNQARENRSAAVVVTNLNDGRDRLVMENETVVGELGIAVEKAFLTGKSSKIEISEKTFFLNVHVPPPRLVVVGAVHISQAMVPMAKAVGFHMQVVDPRSAFATPERFEGVDLQADWPEDVFGKTPLDAYTALAAVTHDPKIDDYALKSALEAGCFYVGALGSRKTHAKRVKRLLDEGLSQILVDNICSPIGLDIGAASPAEIAIAIMAEIVSTFRHRGLKVS